MAGVDARAAELHHAARDWPTRRSGSTPPGLAAAPRPCVRGSARQLAAAAHSTRRPRRNTGPRRRSRRASYARAEHRAHRAVRLLHVAEVARVLHDDRRARSRRRAGRRPRRTIRRSRDSARTVGPSVPSSVLYSFSHAPQPALSTTIGASPGIDATHAGRQPARLAFPAGVHVERAAAIAAAVRAARSRAPVARASPAPPTRWVSRSHASITQPVNSHASGAPPTGTSSGRSETRGQAEPRRHEPQPLRDPQQPRASASSSQWRGSTSEYANHSADASHARPRRRERGARLFHQVAERHGRRARGLAAAARDALLHRGAERVVDRRAACHSTARIAAIRPRGDAISRPVTRYVGQCGRHSPHDTHATSSSSSRCNGRRSRVIAGAVRGCRRWSGSNASLMRRMTSTLGSGRP